MTYKEKLLKMFEILDWRKGTDYRQIAFYLGLDYHKLDSKYKKLEQKNEELENEVKQLKEDRETARDLVWDLVEYIDNTDYIEPEALNGKIASIQNYLR